MVPTLVCSFRKTAAPEGQGGREGCRRGELAGEAMLSSQDMLQGERFRPRESEWTKGKSSVVELREKNNRLKKKKEKKEVRR